MFYYLEGRIAHTDRYLAVVDCGGVGYAVTTSLTTLASLNVGEKKRLYTYLSVREDAMEIFGFLTQEELACFKQLISISGVGPKAAISILSATTPAKLAIAIISEDEKALTSAQGVGKKLAGRIILELKDKISKTDTGVSPVMAAVAGGQNNLAEAIEALMVLGYSRQEAVKAVSGVSPNEKTEEIIRHALKSLVVPMN